MSLTQQQLPAKDKQSGDVVWLVVIAFVVVASAKLILKHIWLSSLSMRPALPLFG